MDFCRLHLTNPFPLIFHNVVLRMLSGRTEPLAPCCAPASPVFTPVSEPFAVGPWSVACLCDGSSRRLVISQRTHFVSCCPLHFQDPGQCPITIGIQEHLLWESIIKRGKNEKPSEKDIGVSMSVCLKASVGERRNAVYIEGTKLYYPLSGF